jgi:imidazoleglycerol-phosphate dehydratase / histidinol-phosphatase
MADKLLVVDREGALIVEPAALRPDTLEGLRLVPGVIPALLRLREAGYRLIVIGTEAGLGGEELAPQRRAAVERYVRDLFASQGVEFSAVLLCPHRAGEPCQCRRPGTALLRDLLAEQSWDRASSAVVGACDADMELAQNLGLPGYTVRPGGSRGQTWQHIAHLLVDRPRTAVVERATRETRVQVAVDLDTHDEAVIHTGLGFFDHMLEQLGKHGGFGLSVQCTGDLGVDEHHTVEDVALTLGEALRRSLGDRRGIERYGFLLPMDETAAEVAIDLGGRPYLVFEGAFSRDRVGDLPTELVPHFFRSLAQTLGAAVHIRVRGENNHHMVEACFKGFARALRQAMAREGLELPTTKGRL